MNDKGKKSSDFQLDAIAWKCRETGLSYGKLMNQYSSAEMEKIYIEYQKVLDERKKNKGLGNQ